MHPIGGSFQSVAYYLLHFPTRHCLSVIKLSFCVTQRVPTAKSEFGEPFCVAVLVQERFNNAILSKSLPREHTVENFSIPEIRVANWEPLA